MLVTAISYRDDRLRMPPTGKLADDEISTLISWVKMGAPWGPGPLTPADYGTTRL